METKLALDLIKKDEIESLSGPKSIKINGIAYDSRDVKKGCLFCALPGVHTNGNRFILDAVGRGASAIIFENSENKIEESVLSVKVKNARRALSFASSVFYGKPSEKLLVVGITGTDGKSTSVWLTHQLLSAIGKKSGFLSTVELLSGSRIVKNPYRQSTPEAPLIHEMLDTMACEGKEIAIIEATSHGLSEKTGRLLDVLFDVALLTNITHEHLEFHGTVEQYRSDKTNLFRSLSHNFEKRLPLSVRHASRPFGIVNINDKNSSYVMSETPAKVFTYGLNNVQADVYAYNIDSGVSGSTFTICSGKEKIDATLNIPGTFNIENALGASLVVTTLFGLDFSDLVPHFSRLTGVKGRMSEVKAGQPFRVIVDYAHTPFAFESVMSMIKPLVKGKLIAVFGSAGERDVEKRPLQGKIASHYCDIIVLTDEDPRLEDREKILCEIANGCTNHVLGKNLFMEPDRSKAISFAFDLASESDIVLLLGKGHEASIIYAEGPKTWDEIEVARKTLAVKGYKE